MIPEPPVPPTYIAGRFRIAPRSLMVIDRVRLDDGEVAGDVHVGDSNSYGLIAAEIVTSWLAAGVVFTGMITWTSLGEIDGAGAAGL